MNKWWPYFVSEVTLMDMNKPECYLTLTIPRKCRYCTWFWGYIVDNEILEYKTHDWCIFSQFSLAKLDVCYPKMVSLAIILKAWQRRHWPEQTTCSKPTHHTWGKRLTRSHAICKNSYKEKCITINPTIYINNFRTMVSNRGCLLWAQMFVYTCQYFLQHHPILICYDIYNIYMIVLHTAAECHYDMV